MGVGKAGLLRRHDEIAGECDLEGTADTSAVDRRDDGLGDGPQSPAGIRGSHLRPELPDLAERIKCNGHMLAGNPNVLQCLIWKKFKATHSGMAMPWKNTAMAKAATCPSVTVPSVRPLTMKATPSLSSAEAAESCPCLCKIMALPAKAAKCRGSISSTMSRSSMASS